MCTHTHTHLSKRTEKQEFRILAVRRLSLQFPSVQCTKEQQSCAFLLSPLSLSSGSHVSHKTLCCYHLEKSLHSCQKVLGDVRLSWQWTIAGQFHRFVERLQNWAVVCDYQVSSLLWYNQCSIITSSSPSLLCVPIFNSHFQWHDMFLLSESKNVFS